ncbi:MAG: MFS transporter, partial [Gammaproteobacteria bacterium]|nr:MFS transporter [Gammaproteobacteria bacterium]
VALAQTLFPPAALARGQSLLGSLGYGLGGMSGALASGWLWDHVGPESPYLAAVLVVLCALGVAVAGLRPGPYR